MVEPLAPPHQGPHPHLHLPHLNSAGEARGRATGHTTTKRPPLTESFFGSAAPSCHRVDPAAVGCSGGLMGWIMACLACAACCLQHCSPACLRCGNKKTRTHGGDGRGEGRRENGRAPRSVPSLRPSLIISRGFVTRCICTSRQARRAGRVGRQPAAGPVSSSLSRTFAPLPNRACRGQRCGRVVVLFWSAWCFWFFGCCPLDRQTSSWCTHAKPALPLSAFCPGHPRAFAPYAG